MGLFFLVVFSARRLGLGNSTDICFEGSCVFFHIHSVYGGHYIHLVTVAVLLAPLEGVIMYYGVGTVSPNCSFSPENRSLQKCTANVV